MPSSGRIAWLRLASIAALTVLVRCTADRGFWDSVAWSIALGHYAMAFVFSRQQLESATARPLRALSLVALLGLGAGLYFGDFSITLYFGIHHVLNEVYLLDRVTANAGHAAIRRLRFAALLLHAVLYAVLVHKEPAFAGLPVRGLFVALGGAYLIFFVALFRARSALRGGEWFENTALELVGIPLAFASLVVRFTTLQVATYHFLFWIVFPLSVPGAASRRPVTYLGWTALLTAACLLVSPISPAPFHLSSQVFVEFAWAASFAHITLSFAVSRMNPRWLVRWFLTPRSSASLAPSREITAPAA